MDKKIEALKEISISVLENFLKNESATDVDFKRAKTAQSVFSSIVKLEQTQSSREATAFFVARELANDKDQLRRFLDASVPQLTKNFPTFHSGDDPKKIQ